MTPLVSRRRLQSVIALAGAVREDCPVMESWPTKSSSLKMSSIASFVLVGT